MCERVRQPSECASSQLRRAPGVVLFSGRARKGLERMKTVVLSGVRTKSLSFIETQHGLSHYVRCDPFPPSILSLPAPCFLLDASCLISIFLLPLNFSFKEEELKPVRKFVESSWAVQLRYL